MPKTASTSSSSDQPKLFETVSVKSPRLKSEVFNEPTSSITPAVTPTAPAIEPITTSTIIGTFANTDTSPTSRPTTSPTSTATQFQSIPIATTMPEPIAKPAAPIAITIAT